MGLGFTTAASSPNGKAYKCRVFSTQLAYDIGVTYFGDHGAKRKAASRKESEASMTYLKAMTAGLTLAVAFLVVFTVCEFAVKYAFSVAVSGGVGGSPGAAMAIPSPLSVVAAVAGFAYGVRKVVRRERVPGRAH